MCLIDQKVAPIQKNHGFYRSQGGSGLPCHPSGLDRRLDLVQSGSDQGNTMCLIDPKVALIE